MQLPLFMVLRKEVTNCHAQLMLVLQVLVKELVLDSAVVDIVLGTQAVAAAA